MSAHRVAQLVLATCVATLVGSGVAWAQGGTSGAIAGAVKDATGGVLPGVSVEVASPALIEKVRVGITDGQGNYRIIELRPGTYSVTFSLPGFGTVRRENIELSTGFTATVNAELEVGQLEQLVTVTGQSPLVDVQNTRTQTVLQREVLDALPTFKSVGGFAALTLGSTNGSLANQDVGGNKGETIAAMSIHGSRTGDLRWKLDGMVWSTPLGTGSTRTHRQNTVSIQEVVVEAGGSAENETGGAQLNYIPRDGGNVLSLYGFSNYTNSSLQSGNLTDELKARGLTAAPGVKEIWDYGFGAGGPIKRDKAWFYVSSRLWGGSEYATNAFFNATPFSLFHQPDVTRPAYGSNWAKDVGGRMTWQAAEKHKINYTHNIQRNCNCHTNSSSTASPETVLASDNYWNQVAQLTWTAPLTSRLLFSAGVSYGHFPQSSHLVLGTQPETIGVRDLSLGVLYNAKASLGGVVDYGEGRRRDTVNEYGSISYVTGSHNFKTGIQMMHGIQDENSYLPNDLTYQFRNQVPASLIQWASPLVHRTRVRSVSVFAQDQWTIKRLTLNYGVRFDQFKGWTLAENLPDIESVRALVCDGPTTQGNCREADVPTGRFVGARSYDKVDNVPRFTDLSPRVSVAYNLFGDGRTAVKASIHRYVAGLGVGIPLSVHPARSIVTSTTRTWNDTFYGAGDPRSRNYAPDCDLHSPETNGECGPMANSLFGTPITATRRDAEVTEGFGNREFGWQGSASIQHELRPGMAVNLGYFRTWYGNFTATDNLSVSPVDYDPYCLTVPSDPRLPDGGGNQICGLFDVQPNKFGQVDSLITQSSNFGEQQDVYNSVDVSMNARFGAGGFLAGGVSFSQTSTGCVVVDSPEEGRPGFCDVTAPWSAGTQAKLSANYPLPWDVQTAVVFQSLPGIPVLATWAVPNAVIAPSLGRNLSACPASTGACTATASVGVIDPETVYEDRHTQLDLRFSKSVRVGRTSIKGMFDIYNVLNASTVISVNNTYGPNWRQPTAIVGPRLFKFGAEFTF